MHPARRISERQHGAITAVQLREAGITTGRVHRMVRDGNLRRFVRGVYLVPALVGDQTLAIASAALLVAPAGAACSHVLAAHLWRLDGVGSLERADVIAPGCARPRRDALVIHRSRLLDGDVTVHRGVRVTTPRRTLLDIARSGRFAEAVCAAESALRQGFDVLDDHRLAQRIGPHVDVRSESPLETRVRLTIVGAGLPTPVPQHVVRDATGAVVARIDLAYPELRVAIECDGSRVHSAPDAVLTDRRRQNALANAGWLVLRFTWYDVTHRPAYIVSQVLAALLARGRRPADRDLGA